MDLFERTEAEFRHGQAQFLTRELKTCSRYVDLASKSHEQGDGASADQAMAYAENGYVAILRLLSDPQCTKHLPLKTDHDFTKQMEALRKALDGLQRFREEDRPSKAS